jgi:hypothetical protein
VHFEIVGAVTQVELIASGRGVRRLSFLQKRYGGRSRRKMKGFATIRLATGAVRSAELHWYEAHGIGRKGWKIKRFLD